MDSPCPIFVFGSQSFQRKGRTRLLRALHADTKTLTTRSVNSLLRILLEDEPLALRPAGAVIATTGLWHHRLCRALANDTVIGSMSRQLGAVNAKIATAVLATVIDLPETIELVPLRSIGWPMAQILHHGPRLNLLSLEALAAALHLNAEICLAEQDNSPMRAAAAQLGITVRTVSD